MNANNIVPLLLDAAYITIIGATTFRNMGWTNPIILFHFPSHLFLPPPLTPFLQAPSHTPNPLAYPSFPSLLLEIGPSNPARGSGERCELPQRGLWWSPSRNQIWCFLALEDDIWTLVGTILYIFPDNDWQI